MAAVRELQAGLTLTPLGGTGRGLPRRRSSVAGELRFFEQLRVWMPGLSARRARPRLPAAFRAARPLCRPPRPSPIRDPELAGALAAGIAAGKQQMEHALTHGNSPAQNGWILTYHAFDYNLDFFEVGALDDANGRSPTPKLRYLERALAARGGLWGNHGYEAAYAMVYVDADGRPLEGRAPL